MKSFSNFLGDSECFAHSSGGLYFQMNLCIVLGPPGISRLGETGASVDRSREVGMLSLNDLRFSWMPNVGQFSLEWRHFLRFQVSGHYV
jgi:hypothetical protein